MKKWLLLLLLISTGAHAALREQQVDYQAGDTTLKGYLVWDDKITGKRPGVLVVHEFWGLNDYARTRARMLAELGYTALAVDMYGEGKVGAHPREASEFMNAVLANADVAKARFVAAKEFLEKQPTVAPNKLAAIGYCFGGGTVLAMARAGVDLKAVASFHGLLNTKTPAQPGQVKAQILVETGADDQMAPMTDVDNFKKEMTAAGVNYHVDVYPSAKHGFTNPDADAIAKQFELPVGYNADADKKSWAALQKLLKEVFAG
ncbi:MAG: dienelactone hydrolase family protein [Verrucomicrobiaceae bacterium]|nr:dienelactone hydrolase family protein [Verrucomicrobiaceae bacterium]